MDNFLQIFYLNSELHGPFLRILIECPEEISSLFIINKRASILLDLFEEKYSLQYYYNSLKIFGGESLKSTLERYFEKMCEKGNLISIQKIVSEYRLDKLGLEKEDSDVFDFELNGYKISGDHFSDYAQIFGSDNPNTLSNFFFYMRLKLKSPLYQKYKMLKNGFDLACKFGNLKIIKYLSNIVRISKHDIFSKHSSSLFIAIRYGNFNVVQWLMSKYNISDEEFKASKFL